MDNPQVKIKVEFDEAKIPSKIFWTSVSLDDQTEQEAKAMLMSFWDAKDSNALRLDLWTKDMRIDEMADFFYQTLMSMSNTYHRAIQDSQLHLEFQKFADDFQKKFKAERLKKQSL